MDQVDKNRDVYTIFTETVAAREKCREIPEATTKHAQMVPLAG